MSCYYYWRPNKIKIKRSFRWSNLEVIGEFASGSFTRVLGQMSVISRPRRDLEVRNRNAEGHHKVREETVFGFLEETKGQISITISYIIYGKIKLFIIKSEL